MANFSPVNRAKTSARVLKEILFKRKWRLQKISARAENPSPVSETLIELSSHSAVARGGAGGGACPPNFFPKK